MILSDGWASAALRLVGDDLGALDLPASLLSLGTLSRDRAVMTIHIDESDESASLHDKLIRVTAFVGEHKGALRSASLLCEIDIFLGWSPRAPQESLRIGAELITLLSEIRASIFVDTYND